jgi:FMN reductase [NAD(P)H]
MDFADVVRRRHMVRGYTGQPVSAEALDRILGMVRRVPSAGFSQGQRLVVVTDAALRKQAGELMEGPYVAMGFPPWISQAPVHIYVCARESSYHERYSTQPVRPGYSQVPWPVPFWWFDCGSLFVLLQLAAINEGLVTGFFSSVYTGDLDDLTRLVDLPADLVLTGVVTIGHPDREHRIVADGAPQVTREPLDELIKWRR